jgi:hypothetical protein
MLLSFSFAGGAGADDGFEVPKNTPAVRAAPFPGYERYRRDVEEQCLLLEADGRKDALLGLVTPQAVDDKECVGCKFLFRLYVTSCKMKKERVVMKKKRTAASEDEAEATPTPVPTPIVRRLPSTELLDVVSATYAKMADDEKNLNENLKAVRKFRDLLASAPGLGTAAKEYFDVLSAYVFAPFERFEKINSNSQAAQPTPNQEHLDSLFE